MEATIISAGSLLVLGLLFFAVMFWYGKNISNFFRPITRMLEAGDMHAQVYASEVKTSAINKASKLKVDKKAFSKAKSNLDEINQFNFDDEVPATQE